MVHYRFWIVSTTHASLPRIQQEIDRCVKHYVSGLQSTFHSNESVQHKSVNDARSLARHELEFVRSLYQQEMITLKLHMNELRTLLHVVVAISPLLGLLGTVSGMISTFDSLGDTSVLSDAGAGVASGVSEALFSTQLGLIISIPGLLLSRMINRKQILVEDHFLQLSEGHIQTLSQPSSLH